MATIADRLQFRGYPVIMVSRYLPDNAVESNALAGQAPWPVEEILLTTATQQVIDETRGRHPDDTAGGVFETISAELMARVLGRWSCPWCGNAIGFAITEWGHTKCPCGADTTCDPMVTEMKIAGVVPYMCVSRASDAGNGDDQVHIAYRVAPPISTEELRASGAAK